MSSLLPEMKVSFCSVWFWIHTFFLHFLFWLCGDQGPPCVTLRVRLSYCSLHDVKLVFFGLPVHAVTSRNCSAVSSFSCCHSYLPWLYWLASFVIVFIRRRKKVATLHVCVCERGRERHSTRPNSQNYFVWSLFMIEIILIIVYCWNILLGFDSSWVVLR